MNFLKVNSKWINNLTLRPETETAGESRRKMLQDIEIRDTFLVRILNAQKEKAQTSAAQQRKSAE